MKYEPDINSDLDFVRKFIYSDRISVLLTLLVYLRFMAPGLRPQTPVRRRLWRGLLKDPWLHKINIH
ncbi:MAG: hypothetical protein O8C61_13410, partial [Candidatus Methanoperedens sp.]|nr:hypothetical protein [Candidatus Methanoperedens sp.]